MDTKKEFEDAIGKEVYRNTKKCIRAAADAVYEIHEQKLNEMSGWISVKDNLPKLKTIRVGTKRMIENSVEVIVTDGDSSWGDFFTLDEGFHPSITYWMPMPPPFKKNKKEFNQAQEDYE